MFKFAVFISGHGSNLAAICKSGLSPHVEIVICNNPNALGLEIAKLYNLPVVIVNHTEYNTREDFELAIHTILKQKTIQLIVLAGFMRILSEYFINLYPNKIINIHPSLLPQFTGTNSIKKAFDAKVKITGVSIHFVTPNLDLGPLIIQGMITIEELDTLESLTIKVHELEHILYPFIIQQFITNNILLLNKKVIIKENEQNKNFINQFKHIINFTS